jgi:hypothetical protein
VEWDLAFYVCLTGDLYGGFSNQLLTLVWGNQFAKERNKFLSIQSAYTVHESRKYLLENWNGIFDPDVIPYMSMDFNQPDTRKCAQQISFEEMFLVMGSDDKRMQYKHLHIPIMKGEIQNTALASVPEVSVHGRSMERECDQYPHVCMTLHPEVPSEEELCDYRQSRIREIFGISTNQSITLYTDNQNQEYDYTYHIRNQHPLAVQLWTMVLSPRHIGNSKSTMDYLIALWKRQLDMAHTIEPKSCYQS